MITFAATSGELSCLHVYDSVFPIIDYLVTDHRCLTSAQGLGLDFYLKDKIKLTVTYGKLVMLYKLSGFPHH